MESQGWAAGSPFDQGLFGMYSFSMRLVSIQPFIPEVLKAGLRGNSRAEYTWANFCRVFSIGPCLRLSESFFALKNHVDDAGCAPRYGIGYAKTI